MSRFSPPFPSGPGVPATVPAPRTGRRAAARLRLGIEARLVTLGGTLCCRLLDLSRGGARVALDPALACGDGGILQVGGFEIFGEVVRSERGSNALFFEEPLGDDHVLAIRAHAEGLERERSDVLRKAARDWVTGGR